VILFQRFHSPLPVALYMMSCCALSVVGATLLRERRAQDLAVEYDDPRVPVRTAVRP